MNAEKALVILAIVTIVIVSGCATNQTATTTTTTTIQPMRQNPCGDGICDSHEESSGTCPQDCNQTPTTLTGAQPTNQHPSPQQKTISVKSTGASYKSTTTKPTGQFQTGQNADIMLSGVGFNDAGGALLFNHPGGIASDGTRLILADRFNNRILIWNSVPDGNKEPDIVLGQKNFFTNNPATGRDGLNWPVAVATDGKKLVVADTYNNRLLIWNTFPTQSGQSADIVISDIGNEPNANKESPISSATLKRKMAWPWAVWTDGEKLVATATSSATVLIWNTFPTADNQSADISIYLPDSFGTPRTVGSDGKHLVIGDHNIRVTGKEGQGNFFWKTFPTKDNQSYDFIIQSASQQNAPQTGTAMGEIFWGPTFTPDGKLIALGENLYIWNSFPENENDAPDLSVGSRNTNSLSGYSFVGGDGSGIAFAGNKLFVSLYNGNKIVAYNSVPTAQQSPDFAIGAPDIQNNTLDSMGFITNSVPATDGKSLFVSSDFDGTLNVWKNLPDETGAKPDFIYDLGMAPWDSALFGNKYILAGKSDIYVWNSLPINGEMPDVKFTRNIGNAVFQEIKGVALDAKYFYISDTSANKIYVWEGIPNADTNPKFVIDTESPTRLSTDGTYLVVAATEAATDERIKFYKIDSLSSDSKPVILRGVRVNLPQDVLATGGKLFVADTGFNRVLVWNSIDDAVTGKAPDIVLGEKDLADTAPEIGKNKLFWPAGLAFDGSYLWVGEFKFSGRLLRFSVGAS